MSNMEWTHEKRIQALMLLPWTVRTEWNDEDGYFVARIAELPSVIATGATEKALAKDLWESLEASLEAYLEFGDGSDIPLPNGRALPWTVDDGANEAKNYFTAVRGEAWELSASAASTEVAA